MSVRLIHEKCVSLWVHHFWTEHTLPGAGRSKGLGVPKSLDAKLAIIVDLQGKPQENEDLFDCKTPRLQPEMMDPFLVGIFRD